MSSTISFRPTEEDKQILRAAARSGATTSDILRRGLRLVAHEQWLEEFHSDAQNLKGEDLNKEPDAW